MYRPQKTALNSDTCSKSQDTCTTGQLATDISVPVHNPSDTPENTVQDDVKTLKLGVAK